MKKNELIDPLGNRITSLRISITNQCNLNCIYCHYEGNPKATKEMTVETISNVIHAAYKLGVRKIKFSGGEPLIRKDFEDILYSLPKMDDVSATTNGILLEKRAHSLKDAGLDRINISIDSLNPETYKYITQTRKSMLSHVFDGITSAIDANLTPIKLNMVLLNGINIDEFEDMLDFAKDYKKNVILQVIEFVDVKNFPKYRIDANAFEKSLKMRSKKSWTRTMHHRKKYIIDDVEVEFVRPMNNSKFCANCNRLRVTADGKLKPCLLVNDNLIKISDDVPLNINEKLKLAVRTRVPYCKPLD